MQNDSERQGVTLSSAEPQRKLCIEITGSHFMWEALSNNKNIKMDEIWGNSFKLRKD